MIGVRVYTSCMTPPAITLDWSGLLTASGATEQSIQALVEWVRLSPAPQALRVVLPRSQRSSLVIRAQRGLLGSGCTVMRK
ncbi:MAG: hypothetical protein G01um101425_571 [Candidatus Peregrinibacteria bacterium Gr01-1014_25]|nr:MAG: hypothetical protein G01um101425_571 [Candidatus Peregrinibacteria bacterium Gr01-1014_25]